MRKLLLSIAAGLAVLGMTAAPAYASVIASVDFTGTFTYDGNGGLTGVNVTDPADTEAAGYVLVVNGTYDNLVFPDSGLGVPRNYILDANITAQLDNSSDPRTLAPTIDLAEWFGGPVSLNFIMGSILDVIDVAYTPDSPTSGTFSFGLEADEDLGFIPSEDSGSGDLIAGSLTLRTAVPAPSTIAIMLLGFGLLAVGFSIRRQVPSPSC